MYLYYLEISVYDYITVCVVTLTMQALLLSFQPSGSDWNDSFTS